QTSDQRGRDAHATCFQRHLISPHFELRELCGTERSCQSDINGVAPARHQNSARARAIMSRVKRPPSAAQINLKICGEIHWLWIGQLADVAEISSRVARGDAQAPAERDRQ